MILKKENESFFEREHSRISSITKLKCSFLAGFIEYLFERQRPYDPTYMWNPNKQNKWINKTETDLMGLDFQSNFHWQSFLLKDIFKILLIHNLTLLNSHSVTNAERTPYNSY